MSGFLLDLNILLALVWEDHVHHGAAHRWFRARHLAGWATCAVTQLGFVRLSSHPKFTADPATPAVAIATLRQMMLTQPAHRFFGEPPGGLLAEGSSGQIVDETFGQAMGHGTVTDAYLVLVARTNAGKLATFDRGLARLFSEHVELLAP